MKRRHAINVAAIITLAGISPLIYDELTGRSFNGHRSGDRAGSVSSGNTLFSELLSSTVQLTDVDACSSATPCATPTPTPSPKPTPTPTPTTAPTPTPTVARTATPAPTSTPSPGSSSTPAPSKAPGQSSTPTPPPGGNSGGPATPAPSSGSGSSGPGTTSGDQGTGSNPGSSGTSGTTGNTAPATALAGTTSPGQVLFAAFQDRPLGSLLYLVVIGFLAALAATYHRQLWGKLATGHLPKLKATVALALAGFAIVLAGLFVLGL